MLFFSVQRPCIRKADFPQVQWLNKEMGIVPQWSGCFAALGLPSL